MDDLTAGQPAPLHLPLFAEQLKRLSTAELRFVVEALRDGAVTARADAECFRDDGPATEARIRTLDELWNRLLSDVNSRMGHAQAAE